MSKSTTEPVIFHGGLDAPQDVWAVVMPSVKEFYHNDGAPRDRTIDYPWGDDRVGLEITIRVWRDDAGVHAKRIE